MMTQHVDKDIKCDSPALNKLVSHPIYRNFNGTPLADKVTDSSAHNISGIKSFNTELDSGEFRIRRRTSVGNGFNNSIYPSSQTKRYNTRNSVMKERNAFSCVKAGQIPQTPQSSNRLRASMSSVQRKKLFTYQDDNFMLMPKTKENNLPNIKENDNKTLPSASSVGPSKKLLDMFNSEHSDEEYY